MDWNSILSITAEKNNNYMWTFELLYVILADLQVPLNVNMITFYFENAPDIIALQTIAWLQEKGKVSLCDYVKVIQDKLLPTFLLQWLLFYALITPI